MGHVGAKLRLTRSEVNALCNYINRLDYRNLAVGPEFITVAANAILQARSSKNAEALRKVGKHWTTRFM